MKLLSSDTIRRCIVALPGHAIITADYDQIELRIAAALAGEQSLIEAAHKGQSLHKVAAIKLFGEKYTPDQYRYTKNVNFGWLYGGGAATLAEQAGIPISDAAGIVKEYTATFTSLSSYKRRNQAKVLKSALSTLEYKAYRSLVSQLFLHRTDTKEGRYQRAVISREIERLCYRRLGTVVTPIYGRRLLVDAHKAYRATNYIIQSLARDIMASGLLRVMEDPELEPTALLPIHDEILGMAPIKDAERIARRYGEVMSTMLEGVPLTAQGKVYGRSWGHGYRTKSS
jgi:DNA polymerase-1